MKSGAAAVIQFVVSLRALGPLVERLVSEA
jgi:hypothetical protein